MGRPSAADRKLFHVLHNFEFVWTLALASKCPPVRQESGNLEAIKNRIAVPIYLGQQRFDSN